MFVGTDKRKTFPLGDPPLLVETLIFLERTDDVSGEVTREQQGYEEHYPTWELAREGHARAVEWPRLADSVRRIGTT
jgi:hypothetical protein